MPQTYSWPWVESKVAQTIEVWQNSAYGPVAGGPQYCAADQWRRETAYDKGLRQVERETKKSPRSRAERLAAQQRLTGAFARFSATALDLRGDAVQMLTGDFLPVGTRLARWARRFDEGLSMADIVQACRNAWTACGLQPLLGERIELTPSILGYSLLYPYTDNYLDRVDLSNEAKRRFSSRFRERLQGEPILAQGGHEGALWALVELIEEQYPRAFNPQVFDCLLAIHRAQEDSIAQLPGNNSCSDDDLLRMSCAKGGTSVLADACLARGWLDDAESRFSFEWGVLLQLGDDLQDVGEDLACGSATLFSRAAAQGTPLDHLATQLLRFSDRVSARMEKLPSGSPILKELLRSSWRSLIVGAVASTHQFFTPGFLDAMERSSPLRFAFLRTRRRRLIGRRGLFEALFDAFLEAPDHEENDLPLPTPVLADG